MRSRWFNVLALVAMLVSMFPMTVSAAPLAAAPTANSKALSEDFESGTFPPTGWVIYNRDAGGSTWAESTTYSHSPTHSARHSYSSAADQNGWLVMPQTNIAAASYALTFWRQVQYPNDNDYHGVWISTASGDPGTVITETGDFVELQELGAGTTTWTEHSIDLSAYVGDDVYLAFVYRGNNADAFVLDDVHVGEAPPNLSVFKSAPSVVSAGDTLTYSISVVNSGQGDALATELVDALPATLEFAEIIAPPEATYNAGDHQIEWTGAISASDQLDVSFVVTATGAALTCQDVITNSAVVDQAISGLLTATVETTIWDNLEYLEDFELDDGGFITSGTNSSWAYGVPTSTVGIGPGAAHSGSNLWATNLEGTYNEYEDSYLTSPVMDLSGYTPVPGYPLYLSMWTWFKTSTISANGELEVSDDGGATWQAIYGPVNGTSAGWEHLMLDVTDYVSDQFMFRFYLEVTSDYTTDYYGFYLDDIALVGCAPPPAIYLSTENSSGNVCADGESTYNYTILNLTGGTVNVNFNQLAGEGDLVFDPASVSVDYGFGSEVQVTVTHQIPEYFAAGATDSAEFEAAAGVYTDVAKVDTLVGNFWIGEDHAETALWPAYASDGDALYYLDGKDTAGDASEIFQIFNPDSGWYTGTTHAAGSFYGGVAGYADGQIFYAPGFADGMVATDAFVAYDIAGDSWSTLSSVPQALGLSAGGMTDGDVFVLAGGSPNAGLLSSTSVYTYDVASDTWYTGASLNALGFTASGAVVVGDKLYVGGNYFATTAFYVYDVSDNAWTQLADLPMGMVSPLFIASGNEIYVTAAGSSASEASFGSWIYDIAGNTWDTFTELPVVASFGRGGGLLNGRLYAYGGGANVNAATSPAPHESNLLLCSYANIAALNGQVTDGNTGLPISGATVVAQALRSLTAVQPVLEADTDASGNYTLTLVPAVYEVTASYKDYTSQMKTVTVTVAGASENFVLGGAALVADKAAFDETLYYNTSLTRTMHVTNTGYSSVDLSVLEFNGGGTTLYMTPMQVVVRASASRAEELAVQELKGGAYRSPETTLDYQAVELAADPIEVLLLTPDKAGGEDISTIVNLIASFSDLNGTVWSDISSSDPTGTDLLAYDVVIIGNNTKWSVSSMTADGVGDALADYIDAGGKVLEGTYLQDYAGWGLSGRYIDEGYSPFTPASADFDSPPYDMDTVYDSSHPIMAGVSSVAGGGWHQDVGLATGATRLADWDTGEIYIAYNNAKDVVAFNQLWFSSASFSGDVPTLIHNSIMYLTAGGAAGGDIPWLSEVPTETVLLPGESVAINVMFDSALVSSFGVYTGDLVLAGGYMPVTIPVQMAVVDNFNVNPTSVEGSAEWGSTDSDSVDLTNYVAASPITYSLSIPVDNVLFSEDFEGSFPPAGWSVVDNSSSGNVWDRNDALGQDNETDGSGYSAATGVDAAFDTELHSPAIDLSGIASAFLTYESNFQDFAGNGDAWLDISTNGGVDWVNLTSWTADHGPTSESVDLSAYLGGQIHLRWRYLCASGLSWYWHIDDVKVVTSPPWLTVSPITGTVVNSLQLDFDFDSAFVDAPGDYTTTVTLSSDQIASDRDIDVLFHVTSPAGITRIEGAVTGNRTASGDGQPLEGVMIDVEGPQSVALTSAADGTYGKWFMPSMTGTYTLTFSYAGYQDAVHVVGLANGVTTTQDVELVLDSPFLNSTPESISDVLAWGASTNHDIGVSNPAPATSALEVALFKVPGGYTPSNMKTVQVQLPAVSASAAQVSSDNQLNSLDIPTTFERSIDVKLMNLALGKIKVLIFSNDPNGSSGDVGGFDDVLKAFPDLDVTIHDLAEMPTVEELLQYQVVIPGGNTSWNVDWDADELGDIFADYVDAGGGVIMTPHTFGLNLGTTAGFTWHLGGRFRTEMSPVLYKDADSGTVYSTATRDLGIYIGGHPLMAGVNSITDNYMAYHDLELRPGSEHVAYYSDGQLYIALNPGKVVLFNQVLMSGNDWSGDVPTLLHNAIMHLAPSDVPWLTISESDLDIAVAGSDTFNVASDASAVSQPGTYTAWVWFDNNDILQAGAYLPVEMKVMPDSTMSFLTGVVSSDRLLAPLEGASLSMDMGTYTKTMASDPSGKFGNWFTSADAGSYSLTVSMPGYVPATVPVQITSGVTTTADVELNLDSAWMHHAAESMSVQLMPGAQITRTITLENFGQQDLTYAVKEVPPTMTLSSLPISVFSNEGPMQIEPQVEMQFSEKGSGSYLVYLREHADLSPALNMEWVARGRFVANALQSVAKTSQAEIIAYLDAQGADYKAYWVDNVIVVENSDYVSFKGLTTFSTVWAIRARRTPVLYEPIETSEDSAPQAIESNLTHVRADAVWNALNVTGKGLVVANIDTGVRYTHDALVDHYRGNLGSSFDHNYNWWDPYNNTTAPVDSDDHGSHTMGTMVGDDGADNQIGIAPGAQWIACQGFSPSATDAGLLECGQFMLAPWDLNEQNPNADLRPHVVNNSWGDCGTSVDSWYKGTIDAWHAAGVYPVFSNGNAGNCSYSYPPGLNTVGNPARYGNVTGVGSTGKDDGAYATHSNWGPTDDADTVNPAGYANLKPQVVAPGVSIRSAYRGADDLYGNMGGTSMSAPHVTGLIALMWEAAPCLMGDYANTETLIEETAIAIPYASGNGDEGPGNVPNHATGWGEIDAYAAVEAATDFCGVDVVWVTETPITGTITPMNNGEISVLFDATDMITGVYTATLRISHNDLLTETVSLPLKLTVGDVPVVVEYTFYIPLVVKN